MAVKTGSAPDPSDDPDRAPSGSVSSTPRIGLALGGGSARGLAHIAILEALDDLGLRPAVIAGTSMGAICGGLYATGLPAAEMRALFLAELRSRIGFARRNAGRLAAGVSSLWSLRRPGAIDIVTLFEMLLPAALHCDFSTLKIPFVAIAADFYAIEPVLLERGPLLPAIAASCALPHWARPVVLEGRVLIDGGFVSPVPFEVVRGKADVTIAVDVMSDPQCRHGAGMPALPRPSQARRGSMQLLFHSVTREKLKAAPPDILIRPAVGRFASGDFFKIEEILAAAASAKEELKRKLAEQLEGR
ncbi:MAG TPA: patatin-like phospholipase family protein [Hyphomicrobiaceae bacterium]|nr:patatin-like phospholipase family protein [Hyphomicrobiaceae bacterium]